MSSILEKPQMTLLPIEEDIERVTDGINQPAIGLEIIQEPSQLENPQQFTEVDIIQEVQSELIQNGNTSIEEEISTPPSKSDKT